MCMLYGWLECCIIWGEGQVMTRKAVSTNVAHYKQLIIFFQIVILLTWDRVFVMFPSKTGLELMTSLLYLYNSLVDRHTPLLVLLLLLGLDIFEEVIGCSSIDCGSWFERILPIVVVWMVHNYGHGTMRILSHISVDMEAETGVQQSINFLLPPLLFNPRSKPMQWCSLHSGWVFLAHFIWFRKALNNGR